MFRNKIICIKSKSSFLSFLNGQQGTEASANCAYPATQSNQSKTNFYFGRSEVINFLLLAATILIQCCIILGPGNDGNDLAIGDVLWQTPAMLFHFVDSSRYQDLLNPFRDISKTVESISVVLAPVIWKFPAVISQFHGLSRRLCLIGVSLSKKPVWLGIPRAFYMYTLRAKALGILNTWAGTKNSCKSGSSASGLSQVSFIHSFTHWHVYTGVDDKKNEYNLWIWESQCLWTLAAHICHSDNSAYFRI